MSIDLTRRVAAARTAALPFTSRGPLTCALIDAVTGGPLDATALLERSRRAVSRGDVIEDDDVQLALFVLYGLAYGSFWSGGADLEWSPPLIEVRTTLEEAFEAELRSRVPVPSLPRADTAAVAGALFDLTSAPGGPQLARYVAKRATLDQLCELLVHRTIYTLREADPHSWAIPRLTGRAKAALVEIQSDEYGGGNPARAHSTIFAQTIRGVGLEDCYGMYVDNVPAITLASHNLMSLFGMNRRLLGAIVGHLAAFEMTSSIPNRFYGDGFRRHGYGEDVTWYFDEHVEADAVHEQIAAHDLAGSLAEDEPELLGDIMFGAAACLAMDDWTGDHILAAWQEGRSSLRVPLTS